MRMTTMMMKMRMRAEKTMRTQSAAAMTKMQP